MKTKAKKKAKQKKIASGKWTTLPEPEMVATSNKQIVPNGPLNTYTLVIQLRILIILNDKSDGQSNRVISDSPLLHPQM